MIEAVPKEGPRAPLFFAAALLVAAATAYDAAAQTVDVAALERCAGLATPAERLACFEALTAATAAPAEPPAQPVAEPAQPTKVADEAPAEVAVPAAPPAAAPAATESIRRPDDPQPAALQPATEPAATPALPSAAAQRGAGAAPAPPPSSAPEPQPIADDLGAEQLDGGGDEPIGPVSATVVRVTRDYRNRLGFHLANGQVWRQIEPRRFRYPKDGAFDVVITQGLMGEYRLRVGGEGPMVRIRRVE